jgi:ribose transport system permease protein
MSFKIGYAAVARNRLIVILAILILAMVGLAPSFFKLSNIINIVSYLSTNGILSIGITLLMIAGYFDLSVGSIMGLSGAIAAILTKSLGPGPAIALGIASGIVLGLTNGLIVTKFRINSFMATLGTMIIFMGITLSITNTRAVYIDSEKFQSFALFKIGGIPIVVFYFLIVALAAWCLAKFTILGKNAFAIGGNLEACRNLGIRVDRNVLNLYVISGVCASFGGVILSARVSSASGRFGESVLMPVIASVILGGVSLTGGVGSIGGVIQGIFLIGVVENITIYLGFYDVWQLLIRSLLLLLVLSFDVLSIRQMNKRLEKRELRIVQEGEHRD